LRVLRTRDRIVRANTWFIQSLLERINESWSHGVMESCMLLAPSFFCATLALISKRPF